MKRILIATLVLASCGAMAQHRHGGYHGGHQSRSYQPQSSQSQVVEQLLQFAMPSGGQQGYQQNYVQPQPVYVQPPPVYVQPRPVYVQQPLYVPQTVYLQPQVIYVPQYIQVPVQPIQPMQPPSPSYVPPPPPVEDFERSSYRRAFLKANI